MNILAALPLIAALAGLMTEALKNVLDSLNRSYKSNLLAGLSAVILGGLYAIACVYTGGGGAWTAETVLGALALIVLAWLCAMLGYDKVIQTIQQFLDD